MTEAAITAEAAPVDGAPLLDVVPSHTAPLGSQAPQDNAASSLDDVLDRAEAKARETAEKEARPPEAKQPDRPETKGKEPEVKDKPETREPQPRENGKFVAKDKPAEAPKPADQKPKPSFTASEPPARFSDDAKAEWATAPESVRREAERAIRELTEGHLKYKAAAERDGKLSEFHDMAQQSGKQLDGVIREYVNMENMLRQDPIKGLETLCQRMGYSLRQVAEHVLGQTPDQNAAKQDQTIIELRNEIAGLKQQIGGVQQTFQQQQETAIGREVNQFKAAHPRFDELSEDIAFFLKNRCPGDLAQAYELAERLNPAPARPDPVTEASTAPVIDLQAQTQKGSKSINGAPSSAGSEPAAKKRSASIDDALDRAFGLTG